MNNVVRLNPAANLVQEAKHEREQLIEQIQKVRKPSSVRATSYSAWIKHWHARHA
jgi:hypothetical protein